MNIMGKYNRCLLKLSGEALGNHNNIYDESNLNKIITQIKKLHSENMELIIVVGGGNIWRGKLAQSIGMDQTSGDYMGMMATVMNALALESVLHRHGVTKTAILSTIEMNKIAEPYYFRTAVNKLEAGNVVIMATGTGFSHFTTDTTAALVAIETNCDVILMAKNGVDGVYSADPKLDPTARRFEKVSMQELLDLHLQVMDQTASALALNSPLDIVVFDMNQDNNIYLAAHEQAYATYVTGGKK